MPSFLCCGLRQSSHRNRHRRDDSDDGLSSDSSKSVLKIQAPHRVASGGNTNDSLDVHCGSLHRRGSLFSPGSKSRIRRRARTTSSMGRSSHEVSSNCSSRVLEDRRYESYDHEHLLEEVVRLRRALDVTYSEMVVTENELREALITLANEREGRSLSEEAPGRSLKHFFHQNKRPVASVRKRSGSCPQVLPPTAANSPVIFSTIKSLLIS